jgi:hypothetical protein
MKGMNFKKGDILLLKRGRRVIKMKITLVDASQRVRLSLGGSRR